MWKHFPAGHRSARARGVLRDLLGPAHRPADAVLRPHPDRRQVAAHRHVGRLELRRQRVQPPARAPATTRSSCAARRAEPTLLVITRRRGHVRAGRRAVGPGDPRDVRRAQDASSAASATSACRAIGPAGEKQQRIASVMNDRYHAFGRQGFGAIYGSKNLKAIVVAGTGEVPVAQARRVQGGLQADHRRVQDAISGSSRGSSRTSPSRRAGSAGCTA